MPNTNKNKKNQPPTGEGKKQSTHSGTANELDKRSEVLQASGNHPELNIGDVEEEEAARDQDFDETNNPNRPKAGR